MMPGPDANPDRKQFAKLKAQASKIGQTLLKVPSGYQISRWGMARYCTSMDEVQAALSRMGAKP